MQLDDVVHVLTKGARVEEAMWRSIRWLDRYIYVYIATSSHTHFVANNRSISAHKRPDEQNLFAIIQGGLDLELRGKCIDGRNCYAYERDIIVHMIVILAMVSRGTPGYAIGGLSGGEDKQQFWRVVNRCTTLLPRDKPRYLMGVGYDSQG